MIIIILIFLVTNFSYAIYDDKKDEIRRLYFYSVESEDTLKKFEKYLSKLNHEFDRNFLLAYQGAYLTLVAKHSINLYTKYYRLKDGLELLNKAIQKDPDNLEFRFIRISILNYVPSFLGFDDLFVKDYDKAIELLKLKDFRLVNKDTQKGIIEFLLRSSKVDSSSKVKLKEIYKDF